jgi:hypothetical protein
MIRDVKLSFGTRVVGRVARELGRVVGYAFLPVSSLMQRLWIIEYPQALQRYGGVRLIAFPHVGQNVVVAL